MFTREDTKAVKGFAVLMMLFHHMAAFPDRQPPEFEGFVTLWQPFAEEGYLKTMATAFRLCVAIFYFVGGYGLYKRWNQNQYSLTKSIFALYKSYWKVFAVFVPIAFIFFQRTGEGLLPNYQRYFITDKREFISMILANFLGLADSINSEWWFLTAYLCVMPMGLLFCIATKKNKSFTFSMFLVIVIDIFVRNIFDDIADIEHFSNLKSNFFYTHFLNMEGTSPFFAGIVFAKHDKLDTCKNYLMRFRISGLIGLLGCLGVLYVRSFILGEYIEVIHAIVFTIFASVLADSLRPLKTAVCFAGKYSTEMWLIHSFFCFHFCEMARLVYITRSALIDFLILTALTLGSALLLEQFYKALAKLQPQMKKFLLRPVPEES
ncbi:MAG: acyltransferase family protein [Oscillospiraceae bacterium]|nr:acyltransferase family protein [Oscillospiraceae bacterium]